MRGGRKYHQPSNKWYGLGINITRFFPDDGWLAMDGNEKEWCVAFHGIGQIGLPEFVLPKIINEGFR